MTIVMPEKRCLHSRFQWPWSLDL